jgi:ferritin-like metal-binding protein YciE
MSTGYASLDEKGQKVIADWVGDMVALEAHIEEALDHQLKVKDQVPAAAAAVQKFHDSTKANRDRLKAYQEKIGSTAGNPVIAAGASVLGKAAGLIDRVRNDTVTKSLRDDYTAFNHATVGYTLLHTTATALGDTETADLAAANLKVHAANVQHINHIISDVAMAEIQKDGYPVRDASAADTTRKAIDSIWKETDQAGSSL